MEWARQLFSSSGFMARGFCYLWAPALVWLDVISDCLLAAACMAIFVLLLGLFRKRRDLPDRWVLLCMALFAGACGATQALEAVTVWVPVYWISGGAKALTALASASAAVLLFGLVSKVQALPSAGIPLPPAPPSLRETESRARMEKELRRDAQVLNLAGDAILILDLEDRITYWNHGAERLYGISSAEAVGRFVHLLLRTVFPQPLEAIRRELERTGQWSGELLQQRQDGGTLTVYSRWSLQREEDGQPAAIVAINRDITAQRKAEKQLRASEETNRLLLQAVVDSAVFRLDPQGRVASWNTGARRIKGYEAEEILGRHFRCFYPAEDAAAGKPEQALRQAASSGHYTDEGWRVRKDGSRFWASVVMSALRDEQGHLLGFSKVTRDRTEKREAERAVQQSRDDLDRHVAKRTAELTAAVKVFQENQQLLSMAHRAGRICTFVYLPSADRVTWIGDMALLYGIQDGALPATFEEWQRLVHAEDRESFRTAVSGACKAPVQIFYRVVWPDGSDHWLSLRAQLFTPGSGMEVRVIGVNVDVTLRVRAEAEVRRLNAELERRVTVRTAQLEAANRDLQSLAYSVSHDLRAPLRHIDGFARILTDDCASQLDPMARRHLERIRGETQRMGLLMDGLLNLSRVGQGELELRSTDFGPLARKAIADLEGEADGRNVEWRVADLPVAACDAGLLQQVFANLLSNALKFTRGRDPAVIEVGRAVRDGNAVLFVRDNGVGFDPRYADKLFGVFQRLHRQEEFEGAGVGLAIVDRAIRKHGGRIWAESEPGRGATFYFTLPGIAEESSEVTARMEGAA